jgi:hypothetical protein
MEELFCKNFLPTNFKNLQFTVRKRTSGTHVSLNLNNSLVFVHFYNPISDSFRV